MSSALRRKKVWADTEVAFSAATTQQAIDLLAAFRTTAGSATVGLTAMSINIQQSAGVAAGTGTFATAWALGLYVDSSTSTAAELAGPDADPYEDWMWNTRYYVGNNTFGWLSNTDRAYFPQVRSRRKIDELQQTLWLVAQPILGGATSLSYDAHVRVLLALP